LPEQEAVVLSYILAFVGHSLHNISQAGQKIALASIKRRPVGGKLLWAGATIGTSASFFILLAAVSLGSVATVGAMAGTGLVSLAVFSHFVMKERLTWRHLASIGAIIAGAALIGLFVGTGQDVANRRVLIWVLVIGIIVYTASWIATRRRGAQGMVIGSFAGFLGAFVHLFQKLGTLELDLRAGVGQYASAVLRDPITLVWIVLSIVSMLILQFAYGHGSAIQIIPSYMATYITVPVIGGVVFFSESLVALQWVGVVLIGSGTLFLSGHEVLGQPGPIDRAEMIAQSHTAKTGEGE
jgi:drug/metabolite transporter (DMT)-like permease